MNKDTVRYWVIFSWAITFVFVPLSFSFGQNRTAHAEEITVGKIEIKRVWSRATPRGARVGAGYSTIRNVGPKSDRLVSAQSEIADRVEMHTMTILDGIMRMRPLTNGVEIRPGETIVFKPGGHHFMFISLKRPIIKGEEFKASLVFENAGMVDLNFIAEGIGSPGPK